MTAPARTRTSDDLIRAEGPVLAHNYHPLPVVVARAEGTWVIVDLDAAAAQSQTGALLHTQLRVGERTYTATERGETGDNLGLITGVPRQGSVAFEVAEDAIDGEAEIVLSWHDTDDADGIIAVTVDLGELAVENEVVLDEIGWTD